MPYGLIDDYQGTKKCLEKKLQETQVAILLLKEENQKLKNKIKHQQKTIKRLRKHETTK